MTLVPINERSENEAAYRMLENVLTDHATPFHRRCGWPGGSDKFPVYWHRKEQFWVFFNKGKKDRYSCAFGTMDPEPNHTLQMTCQINPRREGINRQCMGVFLKDGKSGMYLARNPKIKNINDDTAFIGRYSGNLQEIEWPDGVSSEVVVFGKICGKAFLNDISTFLHVVESVKANRTDPTPDLVSQRNPDLTFTPEFEGPKKPYTLTAAIESQCWHGTVVNTLHAEIAAIGLEGYRTKLIDLYLADEDGSITHLFEIKTDQCTTSIYQAVGQVMLHEALKRSDPRRILVLPGEVSTETASRMKRLGIEVIQYDSNGTTPVFRSLKKVLT